MFTDSPCIGSTWDSFAAVVGNGALIDVSTALDATTLLGNPAKISKHELNWSRISL